MKQFRRISSCVAAVILAASFSGCDTSDVAGETSTDMNPDQVTEIESQLRAKLSLKAAQAEYKAAVTAMADTIAALMPGTTWQFAQDTWTGCGGKYSPTRAKRLHLGRLQRTNTRCNLAQSITGYEERCRTVGCHAIRHIQGPAG